MCRSNSEERFVVFSESLASRGSLPMNCVRTMEVDSTLLVVASAIERVGIDQLAARSFLSLFAGRSLLAPRVKVDE